MTKKVNNHNSNSPMGIGEIGTIRDILMGQQISEYEKKFEVMQAELQELKKIVASLEQKSSDNSKSLGEEMSVGFQNLERILGENMKNVDVKFEALKNDERKRFGLLLGELSKKIMEK